MGLIGSRRLVPLNQFHGTTKLQPFIHLNCKFKIQFFLPCVERFPLLVL